MDQFEIIDEQARAYYDARTQARDQVLVQARKLTRLCAVTIRAIHRGESQAAHLTLEEAAGLVKEIKANLVEYPDLYFAGYTQDAIKEFAEASVTCALIEKQALPLPGELGIETSTYVNGMAESIGELRRRCLDILRQGYSQDAERLLACMDEIYALLVTMDYPDAVTNGLRRQTDLARGIVERTRADLTMALREQQLQNALRDFENRLPGAFSQTE